MYIYLLPPILIQNKSIQNKLYPKQYIYINL